MSLLTTPVARRGRPFDVEAEAEGADRPPEDLVADDPPPPPTPEAEPDRPRPPWWGPDGDLTPLEAVAVGVVFAASVVAATGLVLAWWDAHGPFLIFTVTVLALVSATLLVRALGWPRIRWSFFDVGVAVALAVLASILFFPGFELAAKNRDPGVYVNHAVAIARTGSITVPDPTLGVDLPPSALSDAEIQAASLEGSDTPGPGRSIARGFAQDPDDVHRRLPSFFHLWPVVMATAYDLAGVDGLFGVGPLLGVLTVVLVLLAGRRAFGLLAGAAAALLLTVNMLEVWQVKYPTAEALGQFFFVGALASLLIAVRTRWWPAAGVAGVATGLYFLARPEGLYVVLLAVAVGLGLAAVGRFGPACGWFGLGLGPPLLLGLYQAYVRSGGYAGRQQGFIGFGTLVKGLLVAVVLANLVVLARRLWPSVRRRIDEADVRRVSLVTGLVGAVLFAGYLVFSWYRKDWLPTPYHLKRGGDRVRSYDELNLVRLSWFLTVPGVVVAAGAVFYGALARWRVAWIAVVPGLLVTPMLLWNPRVAPNMMWWGRRYVPVVLVTFVLLIGAAVGAALVRRGRLGWLLLKPLALALVVGMVVAAWSDTRHITDHQEFGGSLDVVRTLDRAAGDDRPVFVWQFSAPGVANFGITPVTWLGLPSVIGPSRITTGDLRTIEEAFGGRPVLVVNNTDAPPYRARDVLERVARLDQVLVTLEQTYETVPDEVETQQMDLTVWRLRPATDRG